MTLQTAIDKLNKKFPGCDAAPMVEFNGRETDGIWFRNSEGHSLSDGLPMFDPYYWDESTFGTHPKVEAALKSLGYYSEAYDSGTLMAYSI
jgi:hypothetical protein